MSRTESTLTFFKYILPGLIFLLCMPLAGYGQEQSGEAYTFEFRGEELRDVLETVAETAKLDLVYDPALIRDITIHKRIRNQGMPDLLQHVLEGTQLDFITLSTGTIVIVKSVRDEPAYGSFAGKVVDGYTGEPLPGANVMFADASGGTSTNRAGNFNLNRLVSGSYNIIFSYVGYEPVYKTIEIRPDRQQREEISLEPKPVHISPVIVTGHVPQMPRMTGDRHNLGENSVWERPGAMRDAIQSLNLFSGVQYGLPMTDLHLQGGQRGDHRMLLDGVPVYNPYSFGQMFSAFSPYAISKVNLHKAGYGVQEGSQIAGLINLNHDVPGSGEQGFMVQGDPLSLNTRTDLELPLGDDDSPLKIMSAFRTNYWNVYRNPTLDQTLREWDEVDPLIMNLVLDQDRESVTYETMEHDSDVRFHDFHFASRYRLNNYHDFNASFYTGRNFVRTDLLAQTFPVEEEPEYAYARDLYDWNNIMGQLTHNWLATPRMDLSTRISYSANRLDHRYLFGTSHDPNIPQLDGAFRAMSASEAFSDFQTVGSAGMLPSQNNENSIRHFTLRSDATYNFTRYFTLEMGIQLDRVSSVVNLSDLFYLPTQTDQQTTFAGSYIDGNFNLGEYWNLNLGSRFTYVHPDGGLYPEPRAGIQYDRPDADSGYWSVRLTGGLYRQFINQFDMTNVGPTALVPSFSIWSHAGNDKLPEAYHLSGSLLYEPANHTSITLEAFHKWQPTTYITSYRNLFAGTSVDRSRFDAFAEATSMTAYGGGVRVTQDFPDARLHMMAGYDYSISNIDMESQFGRTLPAPWNEPHRFQARALWHVHSNISAVAQWQSVAGRAWGFRQAYYDFLLFRDSNYLFLSPEADRLSPFHQLDLSLIFRPSLGFSDLEVRLDFINLLNRKNVIDWSLHPTGSEGEYDIRERTMPGFTPSVSIQFKF